MDIFLFFILFIFCSVKETSGNFTCLTYSAFDFIICQSSLHREHIIKSSLCDGHVNCNEKRDEIPKLCDCQLAFTQYGVRQRIDCENEHAKVLPDQNETRNSLKCNEENICELSINTETIDSLHCSVILAHDPVTLINLYQTHREETSSGFTLFQSTIPETTPNVIIKDTDNHIPVAAIAGGAVGGVLIICVTTIYVLRRRSNTKKESKKPKTVIAELYLNPL